MENGRFGYAQGRILVGTQAAREQVKVSRGYILEK